MKEPVKISINQTDFKPKELLLAGGRHLLAALIGLISSKAAVGGNLLPFGLSMAAGCAPTYLPSVAIGAFFGYFLPAISGGAFYHIAALLAILTIRILIGGYKKIAGNPFFLSGICFLADFLTAAVAFRDTPSGFVKVLTESLLSAGGAFLIRRCFRLFKTVSSGLTSEGLIVLFCSLCIPIIGLNTWKINGMSVGHIAAFFLLFAAAKYGGAVSGTISGTALAFSMLLSGANQYAVVVFAFSGLLSGLLAPFGKYAQVLLPFFITVVITLQSGDPVLFAVFTVEFLFGAVFFLVLPRQAGIRISRLFSSRPKTATAAGLQKSLSMRLDIAAGAMRDVSETVEQVSGELSKINTPDFTAVINRIEQDACTGCKLRMHCWESRRNETVEALLGITGAVKQGDLPENGAPQEFKGRCLRLPNVAGATLRHYSDYISKIAAENRVEEVRSVVSDQFEGVAEMLSSLSRDLENDLKFDTCLAEKAAFALTAFHIHTEEYTCRIDRYGRATIELRIKKEPELVLNKLTIMKAASIACERDFSAPTVTYAGDSVFLVLHEQPALRVDVGIEQKCASESGMCGDAYKVFLDQTGHYLFILSDGMGTGGRAAVDGAMAAGLMSRLVKAGFGFDSALKILNSSMLFKSTDESLATLDIASIDLFNGKTELYKAGAAPTFIRRSGRAGRAESSSLPAGILRDIRFDKATVKCKPGDIVVLVSDGVLADGSDWLREELEHWENGTAQQLAEKLCKGALRRRNGERTDDITVITAILKAAV